jgi:hypothetical protein
MSQWLSHLTAFSAAVATGQAHRFEQAIKAAYEAGAPREELFLAAGSARLLTQIPAPILEKAYAAIHAWYWMERVRVEASSRRSNLICLAAGKVTFAKVPSVSLALVWPMLI